MDALPGYDRSYAYGINTAGKIVGRCIVSGGSRYRAFRTGEPEPINFLHDLGTLGGGTTHSSEATGINNLDQVVGISHNSAGYLRAFLYQNSTGFQDLGTFGGNTSAALAINNHGVVVGKAAIPSGTSLPFVFKPGAAGLQRLDAAIRRDSGFYMEAAEAINDAGEIVGWGTGPYGYANGFVLRPN